MTDTIARLKRTLQEKANEIGIDLSPDTLSGLCDYYLLLSRWNDRLHLVAPCPPEEFTTRHALESLMLLRFLPSDAAMVDVGSGAGLPAIPCLIARTDVKASMIEASQKKSVFLREALNQLGIGDRGTVIPGRFEYMQPPEVEFVTCRALDQFTKQLSRLIDWAPVSSTLLLYGGESLRAKLEERGLHYTEFSIPFSVKRILFVVKAAHDPKVFK